MLNYYIYLYLLKNQKHVTLTKSFMDTMNKYRDTQNKYQKKYKERMQKQYLVGIY